MTYHPIQLYTGTVLKWQHRGFWQLLHDQVRQKLRTQLDRDKHSTLAIADSQFMKNNRKKGSVYGFDGGKKVKGRKRHIVVDAQGLLIGVLVSEANASERLGAVVVLNEAKDKLSKERGSLGRSGLFW